MLHVGVYLPISELFFKTRTAILREVYFERQYNCTFFLYTYRINGTETPPLLEQYIPDADLVNHTPVYYATWANYVYEERHQTPPPHAMCQAFQVASIWLRPVFAIFGLVCYAWLFWHARDSKSLFRTHSGLVAAEIEYLVPRMLSYITAFIIVIMCLNAAAQNWQHGPSGNATTLNPSLEMAKAAATAACAIPFFAVVLLFAAETTRLKMVVDDYCTLLRKTHFEFSIFGPAYMELLEEWDAAQVKFGNIAAFSFFFIGLVTFGVVLIVYGIFAFVDASTPWQGWFPMPGIYTPYVLGPYLMLVYALGQCNACGDAVSAAIRESFMSERGVDSLKLLSLEEWKPCGILLFGRRVRESPSRWVMSFKFSLCQVSIQDLVASTGAAIVAQIAIFASK